MKYLISAFIFSTILIFAACLDTKPNDSSDNPEKIIIEKGQKIAGATFAALSSNLQLAMQEGGVANAVKYCNLSASPLVDSLEKVYDAEIRRTSLKVRNPANQPTKRELQQLQAYQNQFRAGQQLTAKVEDIGENKIAFYAPIHIMPLCQKCHGKIGETIKEEDYNVIRQLYPEDQAINYANGDWRGMWSISIIGNNKKG